MKLLIKCILFCSLVILGGCKQPQPSVIDESRLAEIDVECYTFVDSVKTVKLKVLDITADSVKRIFAELFRNSFPIHVTYSYENRPITDGTKPSLHAYGAAIDINEHMNPYYNVLNGTTSIVPKRYVNRDKDKEKIAKYLKDRGLIGENELNATVNAIMQEADSDDWLYQ